MAFNPFGKFFKPVAVRSYARKPKRKISLTFDVQPRAFSPEKQNVRNRAQLEALEKDTEFSPKKASLRKQPHDIVEFNPSTRQFVVRSQPYRTINWIQYADGRIAFDDPFIVSKKSLKRAEALIRRKSASFSTFNRQTEKYD